MEDHSTIQEIAERERLLAIYRGWKRALLVRMGSVWLQRSNAHTFATWSEALEMWAQTGAADEIPQPKAADRSLAEVRLGKAF